PDRVRERAREAAGFRVLKLKVGVEQDRAMVDAIRDVTDVAIRADANEGYPDRETALREIEWLAGQGVELIEQPLPAARLEDMVWLKERSPLPLIADEAYLQPEDAPALAEAYHGVNVKLVKCGGIATAREAIEIARSCNLQVMIGCTIESSLGIAAAAHLAPLADYVDLDGNLLIENDPFVGHPIQDGHLRLRDAPGLRIVRPAAADEATLIPPDVCNGPGRPSERSAGSEDQGEQADHHQEADQKDDADHAAEEFENRAHAASDQSVASSTFSSTPSSSTAPPVAPAAPPTTAPTGPPTTAPAAAPPRPPVAARSSVVPPQAARNSRARPAAANPSSDRLIASSPNVRVMTAKTPSCRDGSSTGAGAPPDRRPDAGARGRGEGAPGSAFRAGSASNPLRAERGAATGSGSRDSRNHN